MTWKMMGKHLRWWIAALLLKRVFRLVRSDATIYTLSAFEDLTRAMIRESLNDGCSFPSRYPDLPRPPSGT